MKSNSIGGSVILVVMGFAAMGAMLVTVLMFASGSAMKRARQAHRYEQAFFIAEAGIERAKMSLATNLFNIDAFVSNRVFGFGASPVSFAGGEYLVGVRDDLESDGNSNEDTNNTVIVTSTGRYENAAQVIEVKLNMTTAIPPVGSADGALGLYGDYADLIASHPSALIHGEDYDVPLNFECSGSGCDGILTTNPAVAGVYAPTSGMSSILGAEHITGNPPVQTNAGIYTEQDWLNFISIVTQNVDIVLGSGNITSTNLGTRVHPKVCLITGNSKITGTVDGAGIMIVCGGVDIDLTGTFHYEGLVIVIGDNIDDASLEFNDMGNANILGATIVVGGYVDMQIKSSTAMNYSSDALANLDEIWPKEAVNQSSWHVIKPGS